MEFNTGDIVFVRYLYNGSNSIKLKPAIVLLDDYEDLSIAYLTVEIAKYKDDEFAELIDSMDLAEGELNQQYLARLHKINTIGKALCKKIGKLKKNKIDLIIRKMSKIFPGVYYKLFHTSKSFVPGKSKIPYGGRVFDKEEIFNLIDCSLDFWLTAGSYTNKFEQDFADYIGVSYTILVNSGSSANLLAFAALTSHMLENPIKAGDEVITVSSGFPTTVNPIIQYNCVPVFVDVDLETVNIDCNQLERALSKKTRAIVIAHTLGNPFDVDTVTKFCKENNLYLIEDNCDALGSLYKKRLTGTFGHIATQSFYPPHHLTMGEGGAILTSDPHLYKIILSYRDWGRDCWCHSGKDNTCGRRFKGQYGTLPYGYDHKYVYSHIGYNLKPLEFQAAIGLAQLKKLSDFIEHRKKNYSRIKAAVNNVPWLNIQKATSQSEPSWFGALLRVSDDAPITKNELVSHFERKKIATRQLFGGNLVHQPAYIPAKKRIVGNLKNSTWLMNNAFFIGVYPGYSEDHISYIENVIYSLKEL